MRRRAPGQVIERVAQHLDDDEEQEQRDGGGGDRLVLPMAVRMILVRRPPRGADADEPDDVRRRVGQRVKAVGENADGAGRVAERDLGERHDEIQREHPQQDAGDGGVATGPGAGSLGWGLASAEHWPLSTED